MKAMFVPVLVGLAVLAASGASAEPRTVGAFDSIRAQDALRVDISRGDQFSVDVSGPEAARVRTEINGGTLQISEINRPWFGHDRHVAATIHVTMPRVAGIASAKGATVIAEDMLGSEIGLAASMGGELRVGGTCQTVSVTASMGGIIRANDLRCAHATVAASMGGDVQVFASADYTASASMGGEVHVAGGGARGRVATSMGGEVSQD
jgi:hypothetical protein